MKKIISLMIVMMMLVSGCAKDNKDVVIAKVGEQDITISQFEFYLNAIKNQLSGTELSTDADWENMEMDGKKAIEIAREQAMDIAVNNASYKIIYEKMGNKITSEDTKGIESSKENIVSQYGGKKEYKEFLKMSNLTDEFIDMLCESMYLSDKLLKNFALDNKVSDEEINAYFNEHFDDVFSSYRRAKHVLILTQDENTKEAFSEEKKQQAKKTAEEILKKAQSGVNFDELVNSYSQDPGSKSNPDGYTFTDGEMVKEFESCVDSLEFGEIGFVESSYGYHIIKRLELDINYFKPGIENIIIRNRFADFINEKMIEYGITLEETPAYSEYINK